MAWFGKIIEIFLSSPSDVQAERDLIRSTILEWNQRRGRDAGCIFSLLTWEDSVTSELGDYAQGVINAQIGDTYDVMIGVMWSRFGTPTGREDSGTLEEFKRALSRKNKGDPLRISFYFKMADLPRAKLDADQLKRVDDFREMFRSEGGFSRDFTDTEELRSQIHLLLEQIARDKDRYGSERPGEQTTNHRNNEESKPGEASASEEIAIIGLLDAFERMQVASEEFASTMTEWTRRTEILGQVAISATDDMNALAQFGNPPAEDVRAIIDRVTNEFNETSAFVESHSPETTELLREITYLIEVWVDFLPEFTLTDEQAALQLAQLTDLSMGMRTALENNRELIYTIGNLPRLTTQFNIAQKRIIRSYRPFLDGLEKSLAAIETAIDAVDSRLNKPETGQLPTKSAPPNSPKRARPKRKGRRKRKR